MVEKLLEMIRSKEQEARERRSEAGKRKIELVEGARVDGERMLDEVRAEAADAERSLLAEARRRAERTIADLRAENAKQLAAQSVAAKNNSASAVELVMKAFRSTV